MTDWIWAASALLFFLGLAAWIWVAARIMADDDRREPMSGRR